MSTKPYFFAGRHFERVAYRRDLDARLDKQARV